MTWRHGPDGDGAYKVWWHEEEACPGGQPGCRAWLPSGARRPCGLGIQLESVRVGDMQKAGQLDTDREDSLVQVVHHLCILQSKEPGQIIFDLGCCDERGADLQQVYI